ncbi:hypothetical protein DPMN_078833 [Dreissena polymorpha]|uniref:Uncharacterized protein n=1 Tax=Dreissena polymorpha TaxID=45954 RepID=A0A9D4BSH0_DREPO|nr:hypothetical protein DPMN_078833 [Dreissena polymorpha]
MRTPAATQWWANENSLRRCSIAHSDFICNAAACHTWMMAAESKQHTMYRLQDKDLCIIITGAVRSTEIKEMVKSKQIKI